MFGVHCHIFKKVQGTPRSISCIPWLLWTFRSLTPLLQGLTILPNQPCAIKLPLEQLNKLCIVMHHQVLPCDAISHQVLPCYAMHYQVLPCACSTRSWHCAHDHPSTCIGIECPVPPISLCSSVHCPQCSRPCCLLSDPTCESRCALFPLGSSHGCKATHEGLPHADPRLRS